MTTLLPSSRSQPRWAKSASALLTVSRDAPTSWASSSWVRSWVTRSWPPSTEPKRWASCSSCLATRPGHVDEDQVGEHGVGTPQPAGDHPQQLQRRSAGRWVIQSVSAGLRQPGQPGVGDHDRGGRARARVEQRQLAELVGRAHHRDQVLPAVGGLPAELHLAGQHDVEAVAGLALVEEGGAARRVEDLELAAQRLDVGGVDALEQPGPARAPRPRQSLSVAQPARGCLRRILAGDAWSAQPADPRHRAASRPRATAGSARPGCAEPAGAGSRQPVPEPGQRRIGALPDEGVQLLPGWRDRGTPRPRARRPPGSAVPRRAP